MNFSNEKMMTLYESISLFRYKQNRIDNFDNINTIATYLVKNIRKRKTINRKHSSYGLKHIIEDDLFYMCNGEFILSAIIAGYNISNFDIINPSFNMDERDITFICKKEEREKQRIKEQENKEFNLWYRSISQKGFPIEI